MAEEHKQIVTSIVEREDQFAGFTQILEVVANSTCQLEVLTWGPSQTQEMWQKLQPSLARVDRLEELVSWWRPVQP